MRAAKDVYCRLLNLIFPEDCHVCGERLREGSRVPVCRRCLAEPAPMQAEFFCTSCRTPFLNRAPLDESGQCALCRLGLTGFDAAYAYGSHEGALRKLVHLLKYEKIRPLGRILARFVVGVLPKDREFDAIVPMPLHWWRRANRGYNQADALARGISRVTGLPVLRTVRRVKATTPQAGLTNARRRQNMSGAFRVKRRRRGEIAGLRLLLVDDVLTTGTTAAACARVLKRAGAAHVTVAVVARADRRIGLSYAPEVLSTPLASVAGSSA
jgi:ComF family protein